MSPQTAKRVIWPFVDPSSVPESNRLQDFRDFRDKIKNTYKSFLWSIGMYANATKMTASWKIQKNIFQD